MTTVHVHLPALLRAPVRDADEEGRWVTINGAAVHIGKGGNIDKGPKELVGKTENGAHSHTHAERSKQHAAAAEQKGPTHADTALHRKAAQAHAMAAHHFQNSDNHAAAGNLNAAKNTRRAAERDAGTAHAQEDELRKRNPEATQEKKQTEKPAAHAALHSDAEDDVKGSEPHHAEHKRLVKEYDKAGADWQRHAINNQIAKNAGAAVKAKANNAHRDAVTASKQAHETDEVEHHKAAREAIDKAMAAHERTGTPDPDKMKELEKMRKPHHARVLKEKRAQEKADAKAGANGIPPGGNEKPTDGTTTTTKPGDKPPSKPGEKPAPAPAPVTPGQKPKVWRNNRTGGSSTSPLAKMAARKLEHGIKKAAEEAADQDPRHKK